MINNIEKYHSILYYSIAFDCFLLFILQRINGFSLKIGTACPVLLLAAVVVIACFLREWTGFWFGLVSGIALDTVTSGTQVFNTFALLLIGVVSGLLFRYMLNRNIKSVLLAGLGFSLLYFISRWFFLYFLPGNADAAALLLRYQLPSAIYTAAFVLPFYYILRWLTKRYQQ